MRQWIGWALVQIMACRLIGAKPLSKPCWIIVNWTPRNKLQGMFNQNTKFFIHENASENIVCEMVAILSRERWVKCVLKVAVFLLSVYWFGYSSHDRNLWDCSQLHRWSVRCGVSREVEFTIYLLQFGKHVYNKALPKSLLLIHEKWRGASRGKVSWMT